MQIITVNEDSNFLEVERVAKAAFSETPDSTLDEWFSLSYMKAMIQEQRGLCLLAISPEGKGAGIIYAQQENPINGKEGIEKWVIIIAGVDPEFTDQGIGSDLLEELEKQAKARGIKKMFTFTNKGDDKVIHFYHKNGYEDAGWVKDYQYGTDNSAVFLLKYL